MKVENIKPLTWGERLLVDMLGADAVKAYVNLFTTPFLRRKVGWDELLQMAWVQVLKAALTYKDTNTCTFSTYAANGIKMGVLSLVWRHKSRRRVWIQDMELVNPDDHQDRVLVSKLERDRRCPHPERLLHFWCSPDYSEMRRVLDVRSRVILYLRCVEGFTLEEVGEMFDLSRERVRQISEAAAARMNDRRVRGVMTRA